MKLLLYILMIGLPQAAAGQYTQGIVRNDAGKPLQGVIVVNKTSLSGTTTNAEGYYKLRAVYGDTIVHMLAYYATIKTLAASGVDPAVIKMSTLTYTLDEVEILPELEKYEREHEEMLQTYKKTFSDAKRKPKAKVHTSTGMIAGVTIDGAVSELAARLSGKKKKDKRFVETFRAMEMQKYIAIRYNPDMVMKATGTTRDSAITFINAHPMEPDYAFNASTLELLMRIRQDYDAWIEPRKQKSSPARASD